MLTYATNRDSEWHLACRERLGEARRDPSPTFFTRSVCYKFLRVTAHSSALRSLSCARDACRFVADLLASRRFNLLVAASRHAAVLAQTLSELPYLRVNVLHDMHTTVLMHEHGVSRICTRDAGFGRFPFPTVVDLLDQS